jgi:hypothetical protein
MLVAREMQAYRTLDQSWAKVEVTEHDHCLAFGIT